MRTMETTTAILAHQQRARDERSRLNDLITELSAFDETPTFKALDKEEQSLLWSQLEAMEAYLDILDRRIERFGTTHPVCDLCSEPAIVIWSGDTRCESHLTDSARNARASIPFYRATLDNQYNNRSIPMAGKSWHGIQDSTPCSEPERDPNYQPDNTAKRVDWRGMGDSAPSPGTERDPQSRAEEE